MATLTFELVSPERILFSGEVDAVIVPGTEGDMTVLPGHAPVMTALMRTPCPIARGAWVLAPDRGRGGFGSAL